MNPEPNIAVKTLTGLKGLLTGMRITLGYFVRPGTVITQQYPENRETLVIPPLSFGRLELVKDPEKGAFTCNACGLCAKACPNNSIRVERGKDAVTQKPVVSKYVYHLERCTMCRRCVLVCPSKSLRSVPDFEHAVYDVTRLTMILTENCRAATPAEQAETPAATAAKSA